MTRTGGNTDPLQNATVDCPPWWLRSINQCSTLGVVVEATTGYLCALVSSSFLKGHHRNVIFGQQADYTVSGNSLIC